MGGWLVLFLVYAIIGSILSSFIGDLGYRITLVLGGLFLIPMLFNAHKSNKNEEKLYGGMLCQTSGTNSNREKVPIRAFEAGIFINNERFYRYDSISKISVQDTIVSGLFKRSSMRIYLKNGKNYYFEGYGKYHDYLKIKKILRKNRLAEHKIVEW